MAANAEVVMATTHTGAQDGVLKITGAAGVAYAMTCLPVDPNAPAVVTLWARADAPMGVRVDALGHTSGGEVGADWTRLVLRVERPAGVALRVTPMANGALYLYQGMVESGATVPSDWTAAPEDVDADIGGARSAANAAQAAADTAQANLLRVVRIDADGLHVGDNQTTNEVLIDSASVNVVLGGIRYSRFAADYVQFGDYQLRRSIDGGLVFKKK